MFVHMWEHLCRDTLVEIELLGQSITQCMNMVVFLTSFITCLSKLLFFCMMLLLST